MSRTASLIAVLLLLGLTLAAWPGAALATTYYFSTSGSESNSGQDSGHPKLLLTTAASLMLPGNTICLKRDDVWYETTTWSITDKIGTSSQPIVIQDYGTGVKPVIAHFDRIIGGWTKDGSSQRYYHATRIAAGNIMRCLVNGVGKKIVANKSSVTDSTKYYVGSGNVYLYGDPGTTPVELVPCTERTYLQNCSYMTWQNLEFRGGGNNSVAVEAPTDHLTFESCDIRKAGCYAINFRALGGKEGTTQDTHISPYVHNCYINKDWNAAENLGDPDHDDYGDGIAFMTAEGAVIRGNTVIDQGHASVMLLAESTVQYGTHNCLVELNETSQPIVEHGYSLNIEGNEGKCTGNVVRRNYFHNNPTGNQVGGDHNFIYSNIFQHSRPDAFQTGQGACMTIANYSSSGGIVNHHNTFVNNTIYDGTENAIHQCRCTSQPDDPSSNVFKNNLIVKWSEYASRQESSSGTYPTTQVWQYNDFWQPGVPSADVLRRDGDGSSPYTVAEADAAFTGWANNLQVDPLFVNSTPTVPADFELSSSSPVKAAGTPITGISGFVDYDGNAWDPSTPSMGAFQYLGAGQGIITADDSFLFDTGEFLVDEFDGHIVATTGTITFENVSNETMFGDFSLTGLIQAPGDITFSSGTAEMTNFAGTIESTAGSIIFHDFNFIVDKLFSGDFLAYKDITWDPSVFSTYDYNGTWVAATGDITFDSGSEFTVSHRWYDYNTSYIEATLGSIIFTGTEVFIENFDGRMTAGTDFTFDGEDGADFHTDWFFGVIEADNDITFTNGVFDFGQYMTGADINAGHDILFGNTNAGMDSMYATVFAGDLTAGNMLTFQNIYDMELDMVTYESEWTAPNGVKLDAVTLITVFDFDGEIDVANGDIDFINSSVEIGGDFLSWFNASDNIEFTSTTVDIDGDFGYWGEWNAGGDIIFDSSLIEGGHLTIGGDYIGSMEASNITFTDTDLIIGGDFTGEMHAMAGDITFDPSNITVGGDFSGKVEASDNINIDGEVIIDGAFTSHGLWKADGGDMSLSLVADTFVVNGPFDGLITAYDNLAGDFDFNYAGWNGGQIIANSSGGLTGILSGTLDSTGSWGKTSAFSGAGISMYFSIDGDSYSAFTATYNQGITGSIEIGDPLTHLNVFGGTITSAGDIHSVIINGTFINDPVVWNLSAVGTVQYFYAYALGAYVNMKAAHWDTVIIGEGGMSSSFGEILAGNEQLAAPYGTSSIDALTIMGPHPEGAALASKVHAHQGGIWKISESLIVTPLGHDFPVDGGGDVFIKTKGGTVQVDYYNAHLTTGPINEIRHIIYETGKQCDLWATGSSDLIWNPYFPAIGLISAPLAPRPGYTNPIPTSIHDINTKNLDVTEINITGNANNINITNGDLDFLTVGDENYFQGTFDDKAVGNLKNLIIKNGSIGSYIGADIKILSSLSGKIVADEIMGTMELGSAMHSGKFGTIQANYDFDSTLTVYGKLKEIVAKNDTDLDVDITIHGSLNNLTMAKARFTSHVQCEELGGTFDVYGGNADRTLTYGYETTSAQYNTGGVLTVFDITKSQRIH